MNRSILIVICDFLLVSLLVFTNVDISKVADDGAARPAKTEPATTQIESGNDLALVMRQALDEEHRSRDELQNELSKTRDTVSRQQTRLTEQQALLDEHQARLAQQQTLLSEREKQVRTMQQELAERERQLQASQQELTNRDLKVQTFQQELAAREREAERLKGERARIEQDFASAQVNLEALKQQLHDSTVSNAISADLLAAREEQVRKQAAQADILQQQLTGLASSNQVVQAEKQRLSSQLQMAETEKRFAADQVARLDEEVKVQRVEKAKLVEGVAAKQDEIIKELHVNQGLTANSIFTEFATNRVRASFAAVRAGLFGEASKNRASDTLLVADGTNVLALFHVQDTPLTLWEPGTDWESLTGTLGRNTTLCPIRTLSFCLTDPRLVVIPVTPAEVRRLGCKIYTVSSEPYKFQDAVLVGTRDSYYGECRFQVDLTTPEYVKLDHNFLKGIFGKFNPSRGDLVFSKTGELLGIMANSTYCLMLRSFDPIATFQFGPDIRAQHTGATLAALYSQVLTLPPKLQ